MADRYTAAISSIEYYLPEKTLCNAELAIDFPEWPAEKILQKTGIDIRHIAAPDECSSDLAVSAACRLFDSGACKPADIDYVLFCTQSPDYFLPTTACMIQHRLGLPTTIGALDLNLGSSGFVYGLGLAQGLIESRQAKCILLLTGETYSKFISAADHSVRTIFGDAGAATLVKAIPSNEPYLGPFVYGTDGSGAENLIVRGGAMRGRAPASPDSGTETIGGNDCLFMNGPEIFNFTLRRIPALVDELLRRADKKRDDIDVYIFHQASLFMLDYLCRRLQIPAGRFYLCLDGCGNTASSTIPIALKRASEDGTLKPGSLVLLAGFGPGYSWGATLLRWTGPLA
jgi:3-oxoacyl-[acyl-carrier-protein] synthase-3